MPALRFGQTIILLIRLITWGLFIACAWIFIFAPRSVHLFTELFFAALFGVSALVIRVRVRQWRSR